MLNLPVMGPDGCDFIGLAGNCHVTGCQKLQAGDCPRPADILAEEFDQMPRDIDPDCMLVLMVGRKTAEIIWDSIDRQK